MAFSLAQHLTKERQKIQKIEIKDGFTVEVKKPFPRDIERILMAGQTFKLVGDEPLLTQDRSASLKMLASFIVGWSGLTREILLDLIPGLELPEDVKEVLYSPENARVLLEESEEFEEKVFEGLKKLAQANQKREEEIKKN